MVKIKSFVFVIALSLMVCGVAVGSQLSLHDKIGDLNQLANFIKDNYAPIDQKRILYGADIDQLLNRYLSYLPLIKSDEEFYYLVARFEGEFHDMHLMIFAPVYRSANLGFTADLIEGKIFIDKIDRAILSKNVFPFSHGDEIISFDGHPVSEELKSLKGFRGRENPRTEDRSAAFALTDRLGTLVPLPVEKEARLEIRPKRSRTLSKVSVRWNFESMTSNSPRSKRTCTGKSQIKIPENSTMVEDTPFIAYYHPTPKGNVGYLKIGHFMPEEIEKIDSKIWLEKYKEALQVLNKKTNALIVDESGNCGGDGNLLLQIIEMFLNRPVKNPWIARLRAAPLTLKMLKKTLQDEIGENPNSPNIPTIQAEIDVTENSIRAGDLLTPAITFWGPASLQPKSFYNKPIMILINEMAGSAGDLFPALMQDLGRAKLIGSTTAGGGGGDLDYEKIELTHSHIKMDLINRMITYRANGRPLEDLGAQPDHPYSITTKDFLDGYREYRKFYVQKLIGEL